MFEYVLGKKYFHYDKEHCYKMSLKAIALGYKVKYGISYSGQYYYEIVDPFKDCEVDE